MERRTNSCQPSNRLAHVFDDESFEGEAFDPQDYIKRWIDHSEKYGLVYIMNKGSMGILFNDNTKMIFKLKAV
jgi:hypothetical protein